MTSAVIAATGPDNSLMYYRQPIGAPPPWNPEQVAGPADTYATEKKCGNLVSAAQLELCPDTL
jgi:hypothetical protein